MSSQAFIHPCIFSQTSSFANNSIFSNRNSSVSLRRPRTPLNPYRSPPVAISVPRDSSNDDTNNNDNTSTSSSATASPSPSSPPPDDSVIWRTVSSCDAAIPPNPQCTIFFTGGFAAGSLPRTFYKAFLSGIALSANAAVIAYRLPAGLSSDHFHLAKLSAEAFTAASNALDLDLPPNAPIFGIGHSLGAKLLLLACADGHLYASTGKIPMANVFVSFNNADVPQAMPRFDRDFNLEKADEIRAVMERIGDSFAPGSGGDKVMQKAFNVFDAVVSGIGGMGKEFTPGKDETFGIAGSKYCVKNNLVLRFSRDDLDDGEELVRILRARFGKTGVLDRMADGTHVTPMTPDLKKSDGFYSVGSENVDREVRRVATDVGKEMEAAIAVIVAFIRLQIQMTTNKN